MYNFALVLIFKIFLILVLTGFVLFVTIISTINAMTRRSKLFLKSKRAGGGGIPVWKNN